MQKETPEQVREKVWRIARRIRRQQPFLGMPEALAQAVLQLYWHREEKKQAGKKKVIEGTNG